MVSAIKILIVDDEVRLCDSLKGMLACYDVMTAYTGHDAKECLAKQTFDIAILDVSLPDTDGFALMEFITRQCPSTLIIMMTGCASLESAVQALKKGAYDYLKKPFEYEKLVKTIKNALDHKKLECERDRAESDRKKLEEQLRQSHKMEAIGTLAGGIAHDFNNILAAIMGYTEINMDDLKEGTSEYRNSQEVLIAAKRARNLVSQILAISRQTQKEKKPTKITPIVEEGIKFLRASLPSTIEIRRTVQADIDIVNCDATQIHQVLMNLCTNAGYAMKEQGGVLTIKLTQTHLTQEDTKAYSHLSPGPYLVLSVGDTGPGIEKQYFKHIFDPYFTTKEKSEGTGLGLAVVNGIVQELGGEVMFESEAGKGTLFQVMLPLSVHEITAQADDLIELPRGSNEHILFVDDEEILSKMGRQMLERLGYEVVAKTSSVETLETFRDDPDRFDLIITDKTMPHLTGFDLAREVANIRPSMPVILCTGLREAMDVERVKSMHIDEFIMKPFEKHELARKIRKVLDKGAVAKFSVVRRA